MNRVQRQKDRNTDGIMAHVRDYLENRKLQAIRINPKITGVTDDIIWVQLENLRLVLVKPKAFGGEKHRVADVLCGADETRRKSLLSPTDQNSLVTEIINRTDDQARRGADFAIVDMRTMFRFIDPSLENLVQLIQHWIMWDLGDAADLDPRHRPNPT